MDSRVLERGRLVCVDRVTSEAEGIEAQTREALEHIERLLESAGTDKSRLLTVEVRLADLRFREEHETAWNAWIDPAPRPLRILKQATLRRPEALVEIMVTALK